MKCLNNNLNWVVSWSVVVAMLFALGCSGTAVSPLGNDVETDADEIGYAAVMIPDGAITVSSPPSLRNASEIGDLRELLDHSFLVCGPVDIGERLIETWLQYELLEEGKRKR